MYARYKKNQEEVSELKIKLSSLANAPPLSLNKPMPSSWKHEKIENPEAVSRGNLKKLNFGHFENRRGTQLGPLKLNNLKINTPSLTKRGSGGSSFMPKGTFSKNVRRLNEGSKQIESPLINENNRIGNPHRDIKEIENSDVSHYSYEESDCDEDLIQDEANIPNISHLSPSGSVIESPEPNDINTLVHFGKNQIKDVYKPLSREQILQDESNLSLKRLENMAQPVTLKPIEKPVKKKKLSKKVPKIKNDKNRSSPQSNDDTNDEKITLIDKEQNLKLENIQKEWYYKCEEENKKMKESYEKLRRSNSEELKQLEMQLKEQNLKKISKMEDEFSKEYEENKIRHEREIELLKQKNSEIIENEMHNFQNELEKLRKTYQEEINEIEQKKIQELNNKKAKLDEEHEKILEKQKNKFELEIKKNEEFYLEKIEMLKNEFSEKNSAIQKLHNSSQFKENVPFHELEEELHSSLDDLKNLLKDEEEKYKNIKNEKEKILQEKEEIGKELENLKNEISTRQKELSHLEDKKQGANTIYEELQEEIEKLESDLDLLRNEKSEMVVELATLKETITNKKKNLTNLEKSNLSSHNKSLTNLIEKGINTITSYMDTLCQASQTHISSREISCQIQICNVDASCQTFGIRINSNNKTSQTEYETYDKVSQNKEKVDIFEKSSISDDNFIQNIEDSLNGIKTHVDFKIKVIEDQLRSLSEKLNFNDANVYSLPNTSYNNDHINVDMQPQINTTMHHNQFHRIINNSILNDRRKSSIPFDNSNNICECQVGNIASCKVMQDVKNSLYSLNEVFNCGFVSGFKKDFIQDFQQSFPYTGHPLETFYAEYKELQKKYQDIDFKHHFDKDLLNSTKPSYLMTSDNDDYSNHIPKGNWISSYLPHYPNLLTDNKPQDSLIRAQNVIMREKARSWKQQRTHSNNQYDLSLEASSNFSSFPPIVRDNFSSTFKLVPLQHTMSAPEQYPETDYNKWMTRLNALQQRIRSRKLFKNRSLGQL